MVISLLLKEETEVVDVFGTPLDSVSAFSALIKRPSLNTKLFL